MPATLDPATPPCQPHVLVADDDPASCRYLGDTLRSLGVRVTTCADGEQARHAARHQAFDLLLLDCRMPGGGAREVLAALRADTMAASRGSPAVASSAEVDATQRRELLAHGFADTLRKPCPIGELQRILQLLPGMAPELDDAAALRASGNATAMLALRQLLRGELALLLQELDQCRDDTAPLQDRLHRLRSSCGFCGTPALASAMARLQRRLRDAPSAEPAPAIAQFRHAVQRTLQALGD